MAGDHYFPTYPVTDDIQLGLHGIANEAMHYLERRITRHHAINNPPRLASFTSPTPSPLWNPTPISATEVPVTPSTTVEYDTPLPVTSEVRT
jgi:hypothetical protein